jgi:Phospholipid-translocating P-type ATPase C-terminal
VFQNGYSGQIIAESWTLAVYNVIFTVLPPFAIGIFDQFVGARLLDRYPQLYRLGQRGEFVNHSFDCANLVQPQNLLGLGIEWLLPFGSYLHRVLILLQMGWRRIQWSGLGIMGMGHDLVYHSSIDSPWQGRSYNKVSLTHIWC